MAMDNADRAGSFPPREPAVKLGVGIGAFYWTVEAAVDALLLGQGTFWQAVFAPGWHEAWMRLVVLGVLLGIGGSAVSNRRKLEQTRGELADSLDTYRTLSLAIEQSPSVILITDEQGRIEYANPRFAEVTGYAAEEVLGRNPRFLKSERQPAELFETLWSTIAGGEVWRGELCNRNKDGSFFWELATIAPVKDSQGRTTHYLKLAEDITERKQAELTIQKMAFSDRLTGLPNQTLFGQRVTQALEQVRGKDELLAVMFLDLNHFKKVNNTLGHAVGDEMLKQVGVRLIQALRARDTVARLGSDTFTILLSRLTHPDDASKVARTVLDALGHPFECLGNEIYITASVGIAVFPDDGTDTPTLLQNADTALVRAKQQGANGYQHYDRAMNARAREMMVLENHLRRAVERREFLLYYQPQVDLSSGKLCGAEALIRWDHPEQGLVSPAEFIPLAEQTGLILDIGAWVIPTACLQGALWQREHQPLRISVNLSARQFQVRDLAKKVGAFLAQTGLPPACLGIEVTESAIVSDIDQAAATLNQLKELGVHLAIDDFGTGHASLVYLKRFPIDMVKIDRSFIREVDKNPNDAAIVTAVIAMAHTLGIEVLAEGVECRSQLDFLLQNQCHQIQGYLLSPPVSADEFGERMARGSFMVQ